MEGGKESGGKESIRTSDFESGVLGRVTFDEGRDIGPRLETLTGLDIGEEGKVHLDGGCMLARAWKLQYQVTCLICFWVRFPSPWDRGNAPQVGTALVDPSSYDSVFL